MLNFQVPKLKLSSFSATCGYIYLDAATSLARMQQRPSLPHPYIPVYYMLQLRRRRLHHKQLHIHYIQNIHKVLLEVPSAELPSSQVKTFFLQRDLWLYIPRCGHLPRPHAAAAVAASSVHPSVLYAAAPSPPLASG